MAIKKIVIRSSSGTKSYRWWDSSGTLKEYSAGEIGTAKKLEDAIALAKAHAGGSSQQVEVKDD